MKAIECVTLIFTKMIVISICLFFVTVIEMTILRRDLSIPTSHMEINGSTREFLHTVNLGPTAEPDGQAPSRSQHYKGDFFLGQDNPQLGWVGQQA